MAYQSEQKSGSCANCFTNRSKPSRFFVEEPVLSTNLNITADQVGREFVTLMEYDCSDLPQRQLIEQDRLNCFHVRSFHQLR